MDIDKFMKNKKLKPLTLVKLVCSNPSHAKYYPVKIGQHVLFLGEITNMPGHCAITTDGGVVHYGYHTDQFIALTDDEL